jgi:parvulin-like peptidyl-prolyl isomerase
MARVDARERGIMLSSHDFDAERDQTLRRAFPDNIGISDSPTTAPSALRPEDREALIVQFLTQQGMTRTDFDLTMQTNAYLRAIVAPAVRAQIDDAVLREAFNVIHGEKVRCRHIALANMQEVAEAQRRLGSGEPFEQVARTMSRTPRTGEAGGELPPFARTTPGINLSFIDAAFALEVGQVSDPVEYDGKYHLIRLEEKIAPVAVRFEDLKDSVREEVEESGTAEAMKALRQRYASRVLQSVTITDPVLRKQFDDRKAAAQPQPQEKQKLLDRLKPGEVEPTTRAATQPQP